MDYDLGKMFFSSPYKRLILTFVFSFPVLCFWVCLFLVSIKPLTVFPRPERDIPVYIYKDEVEGGSSTITAFEQQEHKLVFKYTIGKGIAFPYVGINMILPYHGAFFDVSAYDSLELELVSAHQTVIKILLGFYIDNYSHEEKLWSYGVMERELSLLPEKKHYELPLASFSIPEWWYQKAPAPLPADLKPNFKKLHSLNIDASIATYADRPETLVASRIAFHKSALSFAVPVIISVFVYGGFYLWWFVRLRRKYRRSKVDLTHGYRQTGLANYKDEELGRVIDCIKMHYTDPDITVHSLYFQTGINIRKINQLLKEKHLGSFKQLLNTLRIEEAKRLLQTTDRQILEIAMAVGFSSATHFNRVFREQTGQTPKAFRFKLKTRP
jgi:two-component system response regulator YesN